MFDALRVFIHVRPAIDDFYRTTLREWQDYENEKTDFGSKPRPERMRKKPTILSDFITQDDFHRQLCKQLKSRLDVRQSSI
jgi:hypothetical protein